MIKRIYSILFFSFSWLAFLHSQSFQFENFTVVDGLALSEITCIVEDQNGLLYIGTHGGGLNIFDGNQFETIKTKDGLLSDFIQCLALDTNGDILVGSQKGMQVYNGRKFTKSFDLFKSCRAILNVGDQLLIAGENALYEKKDNDWIAVHPKIFNAKNPVYDLFKEGNKTYLASRNGLYTWQSNEIEKHPLIQTEIRKIRSYKNKLILVTNDEGILIIENDFNSVLSNKNGLSSNFLSDAISVSSDKYWIASKNKGITIWDSQNNAYSYHYITTENGLASNALNCILKDSWGNIWIGTKNAGLLKYAGQDFTQYQNVGRRIHSILKDHEDKLWVAKDEDGLSVLQDEQWTSLDKKNGFLNIKVNCIHQDQRNRMWFGSDEGLFLWQDSSFILFDKNNGLSNLRITDIISIDDRIYAATFGGGIHYIDYPPNQNGPYFFGSIQIKDGLSSNTIVDLATNSKKDIFYASQNRGVGVISGDDFSRYYNSSNLLSSDQINCIQLDSLDNLWIGTADAGLCRIPASGKGYTHYNTQNGIHSNIIRSISFADYALWLGTERGLNKVIFDTKNQIQSSIYYGKEDGFEGIECLDRSAYYDPNGQLWIGTVNGLSRHNLYENEEAPKAPKIFLDQIKIGQNLIENLDSLLDLNSFQLSADQNQLQLKFKGIDQSVKGRLKYQWKINGKPENWTEAQSSPEINFPYLQAGDYSISVRAANRKGMVSDPRSYSFSIKKAIWQESWFRLLASILGIAFIFFFIRSRFKAKDRKNQIKNEQLELDKNLIELEQKALQLQMNPHFIFNCLNSIQGQIGKEEPKKVKYQLAKFSKLMRSILNHSRSTSIALEEEIQLLNDYFSLEQFSRNQSFDFSIKHEGLDIENLSIPPMMIQPFAENAIVHGIAQLKERRGQIEVLFSIKGKYLLCEIRDNGIGREAASKLKNQQDAKRKSHALEVNSERLDLLHKDKKIKSMQIEDLFDNQGNNIGTKILLHLPLQIN